MTVDDVGNVVNPLIVDGQVHGGIVQGVGQALWEGAVYDALAPLGIAHLDMPLTPQRVWMAMRAPKEASPQEAGPQRARQKEATR